ATKRVGVQVSVPGGGGRLCVPEQLADDRQAEAQPRAHAGVGMAKVMNAEPAEASPLYDRAPWPIKVRPWLFVIGACGLAGDHVGADARQVRENVEGWGVQHDRFLAGFAIGQEQQPALEVYVLPFPEAGASEN